MDEIDVFESAMRIARVEYPDLDVAFYRARLDSFAREGRSRVHGKGPEGIDQFNAYFFGQLGFHGNADDYYDPRNSYLNDVIDRKTGIPITLAAVYREVGLRMGLRIDGVGFPGHYLAKCRTAGGEVLVDCFNGRTVTREDCQAILDASLPGGKPLLPEMFESAPPKETVSRMLNNLRRIHAGRGEFARVIRWIDLDLELWPDSPGDLRERGMLYARLEEFGKAVADLEHYARTAPQATDLPQIRQQVTLLRKLLSQLN